jgi:AGCS family alanine or glycine:cation symporter
MLSALVSASQAIAQDAPLPAAKATVSTTETASSTDAVSSGEAISSSEAVATPATPATPAKPAAAAETLPSGWIASIDRVFGVCVAAISKVIFFNVYRSADGAVQIPFVVAWLFGGALFLTLRMGFINIRAFGHAIKLTSGHYDHKDHKGDVTHFQALAAALSATVGLGNIAGVAIAIGSGGPGAAFWITLCGLLGMSSKFAECTLAQIYRSQDGKGQIIGGPMRYLREGLADLGLPRLGRVLAVVFMVLCIGASFGGGNAFQVGQSLDTIRHQFGLIDRQPWIYGLTMAVLVGLVILGGIRSIGAVAGKLVPFMCIAYIAASLFILLTHWSSLPTAFATIVREAFNPTAIKGGLLGVMVIGLQRALFSNEAGIGSAAIVHSAAKTEEPVSEGIVALLEPFIDTVLVCTMTALVVVVTRVYADPAMESVIANKEGARLTLAAFTSGGYDWFKYVLYLTVVLFAYSTCISWSYYGERCWVEMFGDKTSVIYKLLFLTFTFLGSIITRGNILDFSDLMLLGMGLPNLLGVFLLSGVVKRNLDDYWDRYRSGMIVPHTSDVHLPGRDDDQ